MYKFFIAIFFLFFAGSGYTQNSPSSLSIDWAKKKCSDLGFKPNTERFGNCVLQLSRNDEINSDSQKTVTPLNQLPKIQSPPLLKTFKDCDVCPEMVMIPAGTFMMGTKDDPFAKVQPAKDEQPQHSVSIRTFSIGKYEVTQEQWYSVMGNLPSKFKGRTLPVEQVSWDDVQEFIEKLSAKTGKKYRLPSEAEWEYSARSGSQTEFSFGNSGDDLEKYAWFTNNSSNQTHPVGEKQPNAFGLFDMHGNVWELTQDCWVENYIGAPIDGSARYWDGCWKVLRGGSWANFPQSLRSSLRNKTTRSVFSNEGFRVVRDN